MRNTAQPILWGIRFLRSCVRATEADIANVAQQDNRVEPLLLLIAVSHAHTLDRIWS
jgi:hypothetical protein